MKSKDNRNKPHDYRNWSLDALNAAIMYQVEYGYDTQKLDRLLAARGERGAA